MISEREPLKTRTLRLIRSEAGPLLLAGIASAALAIFLHLATETVIEGETRAWDLRILQSLRVPGQPHQPIGPRALLEAARDLSALGSIAVLNLIALLIIGYTLVRRRFAAALMIVVALGGGMLVCQFLKFSYERARPPVIYREIEVVNTSFPSGHAMLSAVVYLTLAALLARIVRTRREKTYLVLSALLLTLIIGATRIFLGVHWTTDVLAGWTIGCGWACLCWLASFVWEQVTKQRIKTLAPSEDSTEVAQAAEGPRVQA